MRKGPLGGLFLGECGECVEVTYGIILLRQFTFRRVSNCYNISLSVRLNLKSGVLL